MFCQKREIIDGQEALTVSGLGDYDLSDTLECGQCFRYELIKASEEYVEYLTVVGELLIRVGQRQRGELIFFDVSDEDFESVIRPYFSLDTDYSEIRRDILKRVDSEWLKKASDAARGIAILKQDPWEALFSFIISQNNNIPRIRKIIRRLSAEYGVNLSLQNNLKNCPLGRFSTTPCQELCKECGCCYTFPKAEDVVKSPELLNLAKVGFRYKYLCDAAEKVVSGKVRLDMIAAARSYEHTVSSLTEIKGVGIKVASCVALFAFSNLEAFPIDVWIKRAIDEYFDGNLDPASLGRYAGVAQQYIYHYARNLESAEGSAK